MLKWTELTKVQGLFPQDFSQTSRWKSPESQWHKSWFNFLCSWEVGGLTDKDFTAPGSYFYRPLACELCKVWWGIVKGSFEALEIWIFGAIHWSIASWKLGSQLTTRFSNSGNPHCDQSIPPFASIFGGHGLIASLLQGMVGMGQKCQPNMEVVATFKMWFLLHAFAWCWHGSTPKISRFSRVQWCTLEP